MSLDPTNREALMRLGAATAEAVARVLEMFAPDAVQRGEVTAFDNSVAALSGLPRGSVAASVSYVDGVTGANIFVLDPVGARTLAVAMGVPPTEEPEDGDEPIELSELELSAISEASNQTMAAAAAAIGVVLGQEIEISVPTTQVIEEPSAAPEMFGSAPHAVSTTFLIGGRSCRLIQLVPNAFVVRMARALDQIGADTLEHQPVAGAGPSDGEDATVGLAEALAGIDLRVWAELGRTEMGFGDALGLPLGSVVELDKAADAPIDLYVNGMRFARGRLIVTDAGEWAFALDEVAGHESSSTTTSPRTQPQGAVL